MNKTVTTSLAVSALAAGWAVAGGTSETWIQTGRTILLQISQQGKNFEVRYIRAARDRNDLALLRDCVAQRQGGYAHVTCLVYDSAQQLSVIDINGNRPCWKAAAVRRGHAPIEVQPDNPALNLAAACGGRIRLP